MNKELKILSSPAPVSMADEWFEIATADHFWMRWRFNVIVRKLKKFASIKPNTKFLEIGCGHGQFLRQCIGVIPGTVDGCDLNLFALKKIEDAPGDIYVYNIHDKNEQMLNKYDGIFMLDVIEHIDDDKFFLRDAIEHLSPGGLVVINVPALESLYSDYDVVAGHKRRYAKADFIRLFENCGVQPLYVGYWGFSLLGIAFIRKLYLKFVPKNSVIKRGFSPGSSVINFIFKKLMRIELTLFNDPILGTSVIGIGKKVK